MPDTKKYTFFWKSKSPFSQWHQSSFEDESLDIMNKFNIPNFKFDNAEQYMMYCKADTFNDEEIAEKILRAKNPREMKELGRQVKNFNAKEWDGVKYEIVKKGNRLKFSQNPKLLEKLFETGESTLVEASPYDRIWRIGLSGDDPRAMKESLWAGQNLLGQILTEVRNELSINITTNK